MRFPGSVLPVESVCLHLLTVGRDSPSRSSALQLPPMHLQVLSLTLILCLHGRIPRALKIPNTVVPVCAASGCLHLASAHLCSNTAVWAQVSLVKTGFLTLVGPNIPFLSGSMSDRSFSRCLKEGWFLIRDLQEQTHFLGVTRVSGRG